jgi:glycosyltransferase involved in cell wall biosynthesis
MQDRRGMAEPRKMLAILAPGDLRANRLILLFGLLRSIGYQLDARILVRGKIPRDLGKYKIDLQVKVHRVQGIFRIPRIGGLLFRVGGAWWLLRRYLRKSDAVFVTDDLNLASAMWGKALYGLTVCYDMREMFLFGIGSTLSRKRRTLLSAWEKLFIRHVDFITTVDSHRDVWVGRYRRLNAHVQVIKNVPSAVVIDLNSIRARIKNRRLDGGIHVVIVGVIKANKGIEEVVKGCKMSNLPIQLHLVGEVDWKFVNDMKREVTTKGGACQISVKEWMPYNELIEYISQFHIGVFAKQPRIGQYGWIGRGNSRKPFTYMHAGLPVLAPRFRSVALQVEEERCGFRIDMQDPGAIVEGFERIVKDPAEYFEMALNGTKAIESKYNWEIESEEVLKFYGENGKHTLDFKG